MKNFKKYPSTVQYSGVVKQVRHYCNWNKLPLPTLNFSGSVKINGSNGAIGFKPDGEIWFQSRENLITCEKDNAGFATWGSQNLSELRVIYEHIASTNKIEHDSFLIYGEVFGASIQKGVAVSQLKEKKFGIFKMLFLKHKTKIVNDEEVGDKITTEIDSVLYHDFINNLLPTVVVIDAIVSPVQLTIDFTQPHLAQNKLLELTLSVEEECPVGKFFGISGVGEGLVFSCKDVSWLPRWKVKGEKHSVTKVKVMHELTDAEIASKENATEFVEYACTENRLMQGIDKLKEMGLDVEVKSMGAYLKWIGTDILQECGDVLTKSGIERKDVMPLVSQKAKDWFFAHINRLIGVEHKSVWSTKQ